MDSISFEWDKRKSLSNRQKHGVSFDEARTVFEDDNALVIDDPDHSDEEDRFVILGMSAKLRVLVVCHCYRKGDEVIRLISARKAASTEESQYWERLKR